MMHAALPESWEIFLVAQHQHHALVDAIGRREFGRILLKQRLGRPEGNWTAAQLEAMHANYRVELTTFDTVVLVPK